MHGMRAVQMTAREEQTLSLEHYLDKTYCKTASLMANSLRAVAVLGGHSEEVCSRTAESMPIATCMSDCEPASAGDATS